MRVQIVVSALPRIAQIWTATLAMALGVGFCAWFFVLCMPWFEFALTRGIKTEVGRLLMYPWMAIMPLSLILTALAFLVRGTGRSDKPQRNGDP